MYQGYLNLQAIAIAHSNYSDLNAFSVQLPAYV